jgi:hypothetical protein
MEGPVYTEKGDGYYYDVEGVRYHCSGKDGQYTYEHVASVFKGTTDDDRVPSCRRKKYKNKPKLLFQW